MAGRVREMPTLDVVEVRRDMSRATDRVRARRRGRSLGGDATPALPRDLGERARSVAVHHRLHVVEWTVWLAGRVDAPAVVDLVLRRVPATAGQIQAARESHASVDDDDLLMLGGAERHLVVEAEVHARAASSTAAPASGNGSRSVAYSSE